MKFGDITVCLDMRGCPNRCRHCWLSVTPNGNLSVDDLIYVANEFKPYADDFEIFDWYREPDYNDNYKELWELTKSLSTHKTPHFELISYWRAVRDPEYIKWVASLEVKSVQLTVFGGDKITDYFVGRNGAYDEILQTINLLIDNGISPRIQTFVNKTNIGYLDEVLKLIKSLSLEERCRKIGTEFAFFLHQGSCDGENEKFYNNWITKDDIELIPHELLEMALKYSHKSNALEIFGQTEHDLCKELLQDMSIENIVSNTPVFYVDNRFNVYPNYETPSEFWKLGNLKTDGAGEILNNYINNQSIAQRILSTVPICEMAKRCGDFDSQRLFDKSDYKNYLLHSYCKEHIKSGDF